MLSLSIIVPATGRQKELDNTLVSVLENRPKNCEILVPHAESYQDPYDLSDEVRFVPSSSDAVVDLYNAGIRASRADILHLLGSGSEVSAGWTDSPREKLDADTDLAAISPRMQLPPSPTFAVGIRYQRGGSRRVITCRRSNSSPKSVDAPCLHAGFFRNSALLSLGQLDASLDEHYAEVDLAAKMRRGQLKCLHDPQSSVIAQLTQRPTGFRAARQMERVFWRHATAKGRFTTSLIVHLATVTGQMIPQMVSPRLASSMLGHLVGAFECMVRGPGPISSVESAPDSASTIRLHVPEEEAEHVDKIGGNRRGA